MNDTLLTIVGNVVDEPRLRTTGNGHSVANFRIASTSRRFDRERGCFVDNTTLFVNVSAWRLTAENIAASVHKGHPVVVTGRFSLREYTVDEQPRASYELEAVAVGHDLSRGTTEFTRKYPPSRTMTVRRDADGVPVDDSDHYLDIVTDEPAPADAAFAVEFLGEPLDGGETADPALAPA